WAIAKCEWPKRLRSTWEPTAGGRVGNGNQISCYGSELRPFSLQAHNPKIVGSNPTPATRKTTLSQRVSGVVVWVPISLWKHSGSKRSVILRSAGKLSWANHPSRRKRPRLQCADLRP